MRKLFILLFIGLLSSTYLLAQSHKENYQLLWKISGKDLKRPSYLFGTMHITDPRAFDFSDSVLVKLQQCDAFAMEVTPDSVFYELFKSYFDDAFHEDIREMLTEEEYDKLDKKLKKETGVSIRKMNIKDPEKILLLKRQPLVKREDKATFVDAYLYNIARQENKQILGLESVKEQIQLLKDNQKEKIKELIYSEEKSVMMEQLVNIYQEGDLKKIDEFIHKMDTASFNSLLKERNFKMTDRIEVEMADKSLFIAVGAGHLPGEFGLIELLKEKGYNVTPVKATFTGLAGTYKPKPLSASWVTFTSDVHHYMVDLPSQPFQFPLGKDVTEDEGQMYLYPDIGTGLYYYSMGINSPNDITKENEEVFIKKILKELTSSKGTKVLSSKKTMVQGYSAREVKMYEPREKLHTTGKFVFRKNTIYIFFAAANQEDLLNSQDVARYFSSINFTPYKKPNWEVFRSEEDGFEVYTPVHLKRQHNVQEAEGQEVGITMYTGMDHSEGIEFMVARYKYAPGNWIPDDSAFIATVLNSFEISYGKLLNQEDVLLNTNRGKAFTFDFQGKMLIKGKFFSRNNGGYMYFAAMAKDKENDQAINDFLESFKFIDYKRNNNWIDSSYSAYNFSISSPAKFNVDIDSSTYSNSYLYYSSFNSMDPYSGVSYTINVTDYSKYYDYNDSTLFESILEDYLYDNDTVIYKNNFLMDGLPVAEYLIKPKKEIKIKKLKITALGSKGYALYTYVNENEVNDSIHTKFFNSFRFINSNPDLPSREQKAKLLLQDIQSEDSLLQATAKRYIRSFSFEKKDIPQIYKALEVNYDDDSISYFSTRESLLEVLQEVNDSTVYDFLKNFYYKLDSLPLLQRTVLETVTSLKTDRAVDLYIDLMKQHPPVNDISAYSIFSPFYDTLQLISNRYPEFFNLSRNKSFSYEIYRLTTRLIDSSVISKDLLNANIDEVVERENKMLRSEDGVDCWDKITLIKFLSFYMDKPKVMEMIHTFSKESETEVVLEAVKSLIKSGQKVDNAIIEKVADDLIYRNTFYEFLLSNNHTSIFPAKYMTQASFCESALAERLSWDDGSPDKIKVMGSKVIEKDGKKEVYYLLKYSYTGEEETYEYPAICGPQPLNKKEINSQPQIWDSYEQYDKKKTSEYYKLIDGYSY